MARPPKTIHTAKALHALLLASFPAGTELPRSDFNSIVVQTAEVGINQADNITKTGEAAQYWRRINARRGVAGTILLLPTPQQATLPGNTAPSPPSTTTA